MKEDQALYHLAKYPPGTRVCAGTRVSVGYGGMYSRVRRTRDSAGYCVADADTHPLQARGTQVPCSRGVCISRVAAGYTADT